MEPFEIFQNNLFNKNRAQFSEYTNIQWLKSQQALLAQQKRDKLTANLRDNWIFKNTKPFHHQISEGCRLCGHGLWSCLFITNICNASCFYCPTAQLKDETPATQSLTFETAESYASYINHFRFKGVSFSGGEPMLVFDRTLDYLKTIRKQCASDLYIWMYTNGLLVTEEKLRLLAEAGLDEIRFDIGAAGYLLDKVKLAKGIIPNITIEIPAVPEKKEKLKQLLHEMIVAGVTNLNLHQLRLTKHNAPKMMQHKYTYIPAEQPVVLNSELAALDILNYARELKLPIGINYCSFYFKNRYQPAGFRKLLAKSFSLAGESITEKGFLREYDGKILKYKTFTLSESEPTGLTHTKLQLSDKKCFIKIDTVLTVPISSSEQKTRIDELLKAEPDEIPADEFLFRIWQMEYIEKGLRNY